MRYKLIYLIDCVLFLICLVGFYQVIEKPSLPAIFKPGHLVVERLKTVHDESGLTIGDGVKSVNGTLISSQEDLEFLLDAKQIDESVIVTLVRNNSERIVHIRLVPFYGLFYLVVQFIVGGLFFFLALFVFIKQKGEIAAQLFHWVLIGSALIIFTTWGKYTTEPQGSGVLVRIFFSAAYAFTPVVFFHFTFVFPSAKPSWYSLPLKLLYTIAFLFTLLMAVSFIHAKSDGSTLEFRNYNSIFNFTRLLLVVYVVLSIANFIYSFKYANEESERRKLRWILLGLITGPLVFVSLWVIPQIITSKGLVDEEIILIAMLSVPIAFTISIVKYHIFNIDYWFKRSTVYAIVIASVLIIIITVSAVISLFVGNISSQHSVATSVVSAIIITVAFQPVRNWAQVFVDKKFFMVKYNYRLVEKEFIEQIKYCFDAKPLADSLLNSINLNVPVEKSAVYFKKMWGANESVLAKTGFDFNPEGPQIEEFVSAPSDVSIIIGPKDMIEPGVSLSYKETETLVKLGIIVVIKIFSEASGVLGTILLGKKKSGFKFSIEDIDLLSAFAHQVALSIDRINLQNKLSAERFESQKLKTINELKSYFVSSVSHEFKTPLTSIKMFAELLEDKAKKQSRNKEEYLKIIKGESERLSRLIDNVLNISKIERGTKEYMFEEADLNDIVRNAVKIMKYELQINKFELKAAYSKTKLILRADKDALEEVILNLISNAIKYSPKRKMIDVSISKSDDFAILEIKDKGIGISQSNIAKIFQPFERVNSTEVKSRSGAGLGLALVKHIVDAHTGNIEVQSELNHGSSFKITLPLINHLPMKKKRNEKNINN